MSRAPPPAPGPRPKPSPLSLCRAPRGPGAPSRPVRRPAVEQTRDVWPMTPDAQLPVPHGVEIPVSITIGGKTIPAGRLRLKVPGAATRITPELANLLRGIAEQLDGQRHG